MGKYDSAEKKAKWLNSPEYKQQIAEKKKKEAQAAREKILNDNMAKINEELQKTTKAEEAEQKKEDEKREAENKEAENAQLLEDTISQSLQQISETSESKVLTKDKAYDVAGKIIEAYKDIKGVARDEYLQEHFQSVWADHDKQCINSIPQDDAKSFFQDLIGENQGSN